MYLFCSLSLQCGPCRAFTPQLVKTYDKLKEAGKKFEIIFCSSDRDEDSFKEYFESMPWLALPFGDSRKKSLSRAFDVSGNSVCVVSVHISVECRLGKSELGPPPYNRVLLLQEFMDAVLALKEHKIITTKLKS